MVKIIGQMCNIYGISPGRMRWDLLLNDFVKTAVLDYGQYSPTPVRKGSYRPPMLKTYMNK